MDLIHKEMVNRDPRPWFSALSRMFPSSAAHPVTSSGASKPPKAPEKHPMKIKTSDLTGAALDWAVAKAEGVPAELLTYFKNTGALVVTRAIGRSERLDYSTDWAQGGPIIERERIGTWDSAEEAHRGEWAAATNEWMSMDVESDEFLNSPMPYHGPTALIAAMRCYVASKLGDEVDVPEELCS